MQCANTLSNAPGFNDLFYLLSKFQEETVLVLDAGKEGLV